MVSLKIGKTYLDLDDKTNLIIQATTPMLDDDNVGRAFTFDFELPDSPTNIATLKHPNRLERFTQKVENASILFQNLPYLKGKLTVIDVKKTIKTKFANEDRNILDKLDYDLSTFAQETVQLFTDGIVTGITLQWRLDFVTQAFVDGLWNVCSISINGHRFSVTIQNWNASTQNTDLTADGTALADAINAYFGINVATYSIAWRAVLIQHNEIFTFVVENKIAVTPLFSTGEYEHQRIVAGVQALIDVADPSFVFPRVYAPNMYPDNAVFKFMPILNYSVGSQILRNEWTTKASDFRNVLAPGIRLKYILEKIATRLDLTIAGDWWSQSEAQSIFFWNATTLDEFVEENLPNSTTGEKQYLNRWKKSFIPGDFMPKITAKALLSILSKMFGIYYKVQGKRLLLLKKTTLYKQKSRNWTPYLIPESLRYELFEGKGIKISYSFPTDAVVPNNQLQPLQLGDADNSTPYSLEIVTLPMTNFIYHTASYWGKANSNINCILLNRTYNNWTMATSDNKNEVGDIIPNAWSLGFEGSTGIYALHLKTIAELQVAPNASALFDLPTEEITALQRGDFVKIHAHTPNGTLRAIVKAIKIKPNKEEIGFAEVEMLRI